MPAAVAAVVIVPPTQLVKAVQVVVELVAKMSESEQLEQRILAAVVEQAAAVMQPAVQVVRE
jgi:hypothetical protein